MQWETQSSMLLSTCIYEQSIVMGWALSTSNYLESVATGTNIAAIEGRSSGEICTVWMHVAFVMATRPSSPSSVTRLRKQRAVSTLQRAISTSTVRTCVLWVRYIPYLLGISMADREGDNRQRSSCHRWTPMTTGPGIRP